MAPVGDRWHTRCCQDPTRVVRTHRLARRGMVTDGTTSDEANRPAEGASSATIATTATAGPAARTTTRMADHIGPGAGSVSGWESRSLWRPAGLNTLIGAPNTRRRATPGDGGPAGDRRRVGILTSPGPPAGSGARVAGDLMDLALLGSASPPPGASERGARWRRPASSGVAALDLYDAIQLSRRADR